MPRRTLREERLAYRKEQITCTRSIASCAEILSLYFGSFSHRSLTSILSSGGLRSRSNESSFPVKEETQDEKVSDAQNGNEQLKIDVHFLLLSVAQKIIRCYASGYVKYGTECERGN